MMYVSDDVFRQNGQRQKGHYYKVYSQYAFLEDIKWPFGTNTNATNEYQWIKVVCEPMPLMVSIFRKLINFILREN